MDAVTAGQGGHRERAGDGANHSQGFLAFPDTRRLGEGFIIYDHVGDTISCNPTMLNNDDLLYNIIYLD